MFQSLLTKVKENSLVDVNHHLGVLKETVLAESGQYVDNFKSDASFVSQMVRNESEKMNQALFNGQLKLPTFPRMKSQPKLIENSDDENMITLVTEERKESPKPINHGPIAFVDELDVHDVVEENSFTYTYFNDDDDEEEIEEVTINRSFKITEIIRTTKDSNIKRLKKKMKSSLDQCKIKAEVEAEHLRCSLLRENPVNYFLDNSDKLLEHSTLPNLKSLKERLELQICQSNSTLLNLIEEKDDLEVRRDEAAADVRDLMEIQSLS